AAMAHGPHDRAELHTHIVGNFAACFHLLPGSAGLSAGDRSQSATAGNPPEYGDGFVERRLGVGGHVIAHSAIGADDSADAADPATSARPDPGDSSFVSTSRDS